MSYQKRSSTEPEPTTADSLGAIAIVLAAIAGLAFIWSETGALFCRWLARWVLGL